MQMSDKMASKMCSKEKPSAVAESLDRCTDYDVVVIGGAFSGSSSAILLKRRFPDLKILIVEKTEEFDRKVGESTSEVAGCFLTQVLKVGAHLSRKHVAKHGLRMWFHQEDGNIPGDSTEVGPAFQGRLPTFQLNRITLDTHLLENAAMLGCDVVRPANIKNIELDGIGKNTVCYKTADSEMHQVSAGWVIDASGKAAILARKLDILKSNTDAHPVSSMWTRFINVCDLDSVESHEQMPGLCPSVKAQRGFSTNHLMGFGWWSWIIPLDTGEVSVGLTWDERLFTPPADGSMAARIKEHLLKHPVGRVMFKDAVAVENDNRYYKGLPYYSEKIAGDGWTIVGDASGFMDPLYSQGLDFCSHTVYGSHTLLRQYFSGEYIKDEIPIRNKEYVKSYFYWFDAIYKNKYWYMGDAELMFTAFLLDISTYFIGPVRLVYHDQDLEFGKMPYSGFAGHVFARFMRFYNRRLVTLARKKIKAGKYGAKNLNHAFITKNAFTPGTGTLKLMFQGIRLWFKIELRYLFANPVSSERTPSTMTPMPETGNYQKAQSHC